MVDVVQFKNAMSKLSSAVHVVTTDGVAGRHGFTASAVCSVTDTPPTLLVCMNRNTYSYPAFLENGVLAVNLLSHHQEILSNTFASALMSHERFLEGHWSMLVTGSPILEEALVNFDCEIAEVKEVGTHGIFICKIIAIREIQSADYQGLVYFNRAYHPVGIITG